MSFATRLAPVIRFPLTRIILGTAAVFGALLVTRALIERVYEGLDLGPVRFFSIPAVLAVLLGVSLAYVGYVRLVERRAVTELSREGALREAGAGLLVGFSLLGGTIGVLAALGYYQVEAVNPWSTIVSAFAVALFAAWWEELVFRGVLFRVLEESLGTWLALGISAAIFGAVHLGAPNWSVLGLIAIALEAGVLLGAAFVLTRRLWSAIGIHLGWNFGNAFFGVSTGGNRGLFEATVAGPELLSGGADVGRSPIALALVSVVAVFVLVRAHRRGHFRRPFWRRPGDTAPLGTKAVTSSVR